MQRKHWIWISFAVLALVAAFFVYRARSKSEARALGPGPGGSGAPPGTGAPSGSGSPEDRVVSVVLAPVEARDMPIYLEGIGTIAAYNTVTVKPQVDGRIDKVAFTEGQDVKKGDLLVQIDPRPYSIQLHTAQAALARDQAVVAGRKQTFDRAAAQLKEGIATQAQVDDARSALDQAQATLKGDYAQIEAARLQLDYARVTAPIDGVTGARLVDAGNVVRPTDPNGLVVITQVNPIAALFSVPQDDLPKIVKEMAVGPLTVEAWDRDGTTKLATGTLVLVDNQINTATATIRLKAAFPNDARALWPNQFVKVRLLLTTRKGARVVPVAAVQRGPKGMFVYVVGADQKAAVRPVEIEHTESDVAIIAKGLEPGEQVVVDGQFQLKPGSRIAPKPAGSNAPGGSGAAGAGRGPGGAPGASGAANATGSTDVPGAPGGASPALSASASASASASGSALAAPTGPR